MVKTVSPVNSLSGKGFICAGVLLLTFLGASAQLEKRSRLVGGSFNGIAPVENIGIGFSLSLSARGGYFIIDNLAVGLSFGGGYARIKSSVSYSIITYSVGPFARYYFNLSELSKLFVVSNVSYFDGFVTDSISSVPSFISGSAGIGLAHFIAQNLSIEMLLNYATADISKGPAYIRMDIGFQIYLSPKGG